MKRCRWTVELITAPRMNPWPLGYFPRTFYYRRDAAELCTAVAKRGGEAKIRDAKKEQTS